MLAFIHAAEAFPHVETIALAVAVAIAAAMIVAFAAAHVLEQRGQA